MNKRIEGGFAPPEAQDIKSQSLKVESQEAPTNQKEPLKAVNEAPVDPESAAMLERLNRWKESEGQEGQEAFSSSAYDKTTTPAAVAGREQAREVSVNEIADKALEANIKTVEVLKDQLAQAQVDAEKATFLTRWIHTGKVEKLKKDLRYTEAAVRARRAQLETEQPTTTQEPAVELSDVA